MAEAKETYIDDFFREVHESEFDRKDKHDSVDSFLLAVLTVQGGIGFQYLQWIPWDKFGVWEWIFFGLTLSYLVLWAIGAIFVACSVWPRIIGYLSAPKDLSDYLSGLVAHYGFNTSEMDEVERLATPDIKRLARAQYIEAAQVNRESNQRKLKYQTRSKILLCIAVFVILFNALPMYVVQHSHKEPEKVQLVDSQSTQKVEVVTPNTEAKNGRQATTTPAATGSTTTGQTGDTAAKAGPAGDPKATGR